MWRADWAWGMWRKILVVSCFAVLFLAGAVHSQVQATTPDGSAANKIKLADRQRLLSEQMGRSICLVMGGIDAGSEADKARGSAELFQATMLALRTGDENMAILPERDAAVLAALDDVAVLFETYRAATFQVGAGDLHSVPVSQILRLGDPVLDLSDAVMTAVQAVHASAKKPSVTSTVELARRQTILTQTLVKQLCFAALGIDRASMRTRLGATVMAFAAAQDALEKGDVANGILRPTGPIAKKLTAVRALWTDLAAIADVVVRGEPLDDAGLKAVVELSNKILFKCKQVARSYAKL